VPTLQINLQVYTRQGDKVNANYCWQEKLGGFVCGMNGQGMAGCVMADSFHGWAGWQVWTLAGRWSGCVTAGYWGCWLAVLAVYI